MKIDVVGKRADEKLQRFDVCLLFLFELLPGGLGERGEEGCC